MKEGFFKEFEIIEEYLIIMKERGYKGIEVKKFGLVVSVLYGFLVSSLDGFVYDFFYDLVEGMFEMKYI